MDAAALSQKHWSGKPELAQALRAIKAMQFYQYQILLKTKHVPTPWEDPLWSQVSLAQKCVLSLDLVSLL